MIFEAGSWGTDEVNVSTAGFGLFTEKLIHEWVGAIRLSSFYCRVCLSLHLRID